MPQSINIKLILYILALGGGFLFLSLSREKPKTLSAQEIAQIKERWAKLQRLKPAEKKKFEDNRKRYQKMDSLSQEFIKKTYSLWIKLPEETREDCRERLEKLNDLSPEMHQKFLFWGLLLDSLPLDLRNKFNNLPVDRQILILENLDNYYNEKKKKLALMSPDAFRREVRIFANIYEEKIAMLLILPNLIRQLPYDLRQRWWKIGQAERTEIVERLIKTPPRERYRTLIFLLRNTK